MFRHNYTFLTGGHVYSTCLYSLTKRLVHFSQTYGNEGDEEPDEIIEASEVYDQQVVLEEQQQGPSTSSKATDEPLPPTKEEAATALASLSAEDHEATGIEIAEALQKLASAFGITNQDGAKEAMAQLTAAYHGENPEFLLENGGQVAVEEVISEEVVTDEPMVVIEENTAANTESVANTITTAPVISISTSSTSGDNIVIETHTTPIVSTEVVRTSEQIGVRRLCQWLHIANIQITFIPMACDKAILTYVHFKSVMCHDKLTVALVQPFLCAGSSKFTRCV